MEAVINSILDQLNLFILIRGHFLREFQSSTDAIEIFCGETSTIGTCCFYFHIIIFQDYSNSTIYKKKKIN